MNTDKEQFVAALREFLIQRRDTNNTWIAYYLGLHPAINYIRRNDEIQLVLDWIDKQETQTTV